MFKLSYTFRLYLIALFLCFGLQTFAQSSFQLKDGRETNVCGICEVVLKEKPDEVLYGIHLDGDNIKFVNNSPTWFYKLFNQKGLNSLKNVYYSEISSTLFGEIFVKKHSLDDMFI